MTELLPSSPTGEISTAAVQQRPDEAEVQRRRVASIEGLADTLQKQIPVLAPVGPYIKKAAPTVAKGQAALDKLLPHILAAVAKSKAAWGHSTPYAKHHTTQVAIGVLLAFLGGRYPTLIATVVAFKQTGWESTRDALRSIYGDAKRVFDKSRADDHVDADGDGVFDVLQIRKNELVKRKLLIAATTVDPDKLGAALLALNTGFLAVLATLKLQFARAITLGTSISDAVVPLALRHAEPVLSALISSSAGADYVRWSAPSVTLAVKLASMSLAWLVQRIISAVHSAIKGGQIAGKGAVMLLNQAGVMKTDPEDSKVDEAAALIIAALGLLFQLSTRGGRLPFPLSLALMPADVAERVLTYALF